MNLSSERLSFVFAAIGISLLGCFWFSPWRENQFDDYVSISSNPVELGQVLCFEKGHGEIALTNLSSLPIPFRVNADCSCTSLDLTSGVIEPRAKQVVKFTYSPKSIAKLDSSIQPESSDVVVSLLVNETKLSRIVGISALGVFPLIMDPYELSQVVEPFRASEVVVPFGIAKDVQNVRLISAPAFLTETRIEETEGLSTFRANIEMPIGTHTGPIVLKLAVDKVDKAVRIELPLAVVVQKPYAFSTDVCAVTSNSEFVLEVRPKFGALYSEFTAAKSECPHLTAKIEESSSNLLKLICSSSNDAQLPITGRVRVSVRSTDAEGHELTTQDEIPVVISKGGLGDE